MEVFVIATDDLALTNSQEYVEFVWQLKQYVYNNSPFEVYFVFESTIREEGFFIDDFDVDVREYCLRGFSLHQPQKTFHIKLFAEMY